MIKQIAKVGNSNGIIFDKSVMDMARLRTGDEVNLEVHSNGSITITPMRPAISPEQAADTAKRLIGKNSGLFERLS